MTSMQFSYWGAVLQSIRVYNIKCPPIMVLPAFICLQIWAMAKTVCSLISLGELRENVPPTLVAYAASIAGINCIATVLGVVAGVAVAIDGACLVLGALTFVFVLAPSIFTTAVLQSVLTWRERALIVETCALPISFHRGPTYPLPWLGYSNNDDIHNRSRDAGEWCEAEWNSNWTTSLVIVMLTLFVLVICIPICVDYLLQIRDLITSKDPAQFVETSMAKKDTVSNKEEIVFLTSLMAILSGVRVILSLDAMSSVVGRPKFAGYIAAVDIFVVFVEVIGFLVPYKDLRMMAFLNTFVTFPCTLLSTTSYIFSMWYEKTILVDACVGPPSFWRFDYSAVQESCLASWMESWRLVIIFGGIYVSTAALNAVYGYLSVLTNECVASPLPVDKTARTGSQVPEMIRRVVGVVSADESSNGDVKALPRTMVGEDVKNWEMVNEGK